MNAIKHPVFLIGGCSYLVFLIGVMAIRPQNNLTGSVLLGTGILLGAVHWVCSVMDVFKNEALTQESRVFWLILVLLVPPLGGMIYYLSRRKNIKM